LSRRRPRSVTAGDRRDAGATTSAPSLAAVQEVAKSKVPTLGYGYLRVGNVLLALWGAVIVALMQP